jgi:hypothetical protein
MRPRVRTGVYATFDAFYRDMFGIDAAATCGWP